MDHTTAIIQVQANQMGEWREHGTCHITTVGHRLREAHRIHGKRVRAVDRQGRLLDMLG